MSKTIYSIITGSGKYIPTQCVKNDAFLSNEFYESNGKKIDKTNQEIIDKFKEITTIAERRYVTDDLVASDIAFFAAEDALKSSNTDKETLDYIIVAHNFGDITSNSSNRVDMMPGISSRVKYKLGIKNPNCVAYDIPFGCPGWLQGVIQADYYIKSGDAKKVLVIGAETLSRIVDPHDRDSMIYADGAGAVLLEGKESSKPIGIIAHKTRSDTLLHSKMLFMGKSYKQSDSEDLFIKMNGRRLYQYALENVPQTVKECIEKTDIPFEVFKKVLIHQANGKMDDAIIERIYKLFGLEKVGKDIMPMTISKLGNSSVATIPTLYDMIVKGQLNPHKIEENDAIIFASVGAGMNINVVVYKA